MFGDPRLLSVSSRLVTVGRSRVDGVLQYRFALPQVCLDIVHEFLGFRFEAARHVAHVTRRDVCGCFRDVTRKQTSPINEREATDSRKARQLVDNRRLPIEHREQSIGESAKRTYCERNSKRDKSVVLLARESRRTNLSRVEIPIANKLRNASSTIPGRIYVQTWKRA